MRYGRSVTTSGCIKSPAVGFCVILPVAISTFRAFTLHTRPAGCPDRSRPQSRTRRTVPSRRPGGIETVIGQTAHGLTGPAHDEDAPTAAR